MHIILMKDFIKQIIYLSKLYKYIDMNINTKTCNTKLKII